MMRLDDPRRDHWVCYVATQIAALAMFVLVAIWGLIDWVLR